MGYGSGSPENTPAQCLSYAESLGATSAALQYGKYNITIVTGRTKYGAGTPSRDFCNISLEHSLMICTFWADVSYGYYVGWVALKYLRSGDVET